jgi:hypothetical protein
MDITKAYPRPHPQTAGRVIDGEAVLILADASEINVLNPVGSRIYELADGEHSIADIASVVAREFEVTFEEAVTDIMQFLQELTDADVMIVEDREEV